MEFCQWEPCSIHNIRKAHTRKRPVSHAPHILSFLYNLLFHVHLTLSNIEECYNNRGGNRGSSYHMFVLDWWTILKYQDKDQ